MRNGSGLAWVLVVGSVVTSLLTLYALVKAWNKAFWQEVPAEISTGEVGEARVPRGMFAATTALVAAGVALTVFAGPIYGYAQRAAAALTDGHTYKEAVFLGGVPAGVSDVVREGSAGGAHGEEYGYGDEDRDRDEDRHRGEEYGPGDEDENGDEEGGG